MFTQTIGHWLSVGELVIALKLVERMPTELQEEGYDRILGYALGNHNAWLMGKVLQKLDRSMTDAERAEWCGSMRFATDLDVLRSLRNIAAEISNDELRVSTEKNIDIACLRAGFPEEVTSLSSEEIISWVVESLGNGVSEDNVRLAMNHFVLEYNPALRVAREAVVQTIDLDRALAIVRIMGDRTLRPSELLMMRKVKSRYAGDIFVVSRHLTFLMELSELLPPRNKLPTLRWVVTEYIRIGDTMTARGLLDKLPERERSRYAAKILRCQLSRSGDKGTGDIWVTEQYLGRELRPKEIKQRLSRGFGNQAEQLKLILRLKKSERTPYLEKLLSYYIQMAHLPEALEVASHVPRDLSKQELFMLLSAAHGFYNAALSQKTLEKQWIASSRARLEEIARYIVGALPATPSV